MQELLKIYTLNTIYAGIDERRYSQQVRTIVRVPRTVLLYMHTSVRGIYFTVSPRTKNCAIEHSNIYLPVVTIDAQPVSGGRSVGTGEV